MSASEVAFALMSGLTVSGITGSVMELAQAARVSFSEPYLSRRHPLRSLAYTALAGPMMLANDALDARREGAISALLLAFCATTALVWATALGTVVIGLAARASALLL